MFKAIILVVALVAIVGAAYPGGLSQEEPIDDTVLGLVKSVHREIETAAGTRFTHVRPVSMRKQVVAGMNYFIKAYAKPINSDREIVLHLRVYQPLGLAPSKLTSILTDVGEQRALDFFH